MDFLVPHHLIDGGVIGIALILHYFFWFSNGTIHVDP
ncbi:YitT family protein [Peribacillus frigoritolerans]|nr:YitT family protein [Peribacillus frigoritolerans]